MTSRVSTGEQFHQLKAAIRSDSSLDEKMQTVSKVLSNPDFQTQMYRSDRNEIRVIRQLNILVKQHPGEKKRILSEVRDAMSQRKVSHYHTHVQGGTFYTSDRKPSLLSKFNEKIDELFDKTLAAVARFV